MVIDVARDTRSETISSKPFQYALQYTYFDRKISDWFETIIFH